MLKDENIICISSIDWDFVWQGHQEIMSTFAKNGNRVLFIENTGVRNPAFKDINRLIKRIKNWFKSVRGYREIQKNLYLFSPVLLPFPYSKVAQWINKLVLLRSIKRWMKAAEFYDPIVWTFLPTTLSLDIINNLDNKLVVYYCIANFDELAGNPKKMRKTEEKLIKSCDLIFAQGKVLKDKCRKFNDNVTIFPFGVKFETFKEFQNSDDEIPDDIKNIGLPVIGYIGGIHKHIDFNLLEYIAKDKPEWAFVFIGPVQTDVSQIRKLLNVYFLGQKDFSVLPIYISKIDVCVIPYRLTEYTKTVYPTKMNEYHAMGKPVVSTLLPEVVEFNKKNNNLVLLAKTKEEFSKRLNEAMNDGSEKLCNDRIKSAKLNSWSNRIEEMSGLMEQSIHTKKEKMAFAWQTKLLKSFKSSRKRVALTCFTFALLWGLMFHSPLIWIIAYPLKIAESPKKVDVIAVFGGGVGETGSFGKSTIGRARYAAELYNDNYAEKIIFSSGYTVKFNDAESMELIAISLGVPEDNIVLEQKANSAYENVRYVLIIMKKNGWDSALVVSSPYNMLRVSLVFKNLRKGIKEIVYTPVLDSHFYSDVPEKRWAQMKAIWHEYLGIIYYWWMGYI